MAATEAGRRAMAMAGILLASAVMASSAAPLDLKALIASKGNDRSGGEILISQNDDINKHSGEGGGSSHTLTSPIGVHYYTNSVFRPYHGYGRQLFVRGNPDQHPFEKEVSHEEVRICFI